MCLKKKICKYLCSNQTNMSDFQSLEVAINPQLQVAENLRVKVCVHDTRCEEGNICLTS